MASIVPISEAESVAAVATIVAAFADDPVERWLWPEQEAYDAAFPEFARAFGGAAFERGTAWGIEGSGAVALWLEPGAEADEAAVAGVLDETVAIDKHDDLFATLEQMAALHPTEPHWYLPWLAVSPAHQGRGLGGELLDHTLAIIDTAALPAFLETTNPRTIPLYERHGFKTIATSWSGACPPMTSMLRPAGQRALTMQIESRTLRLQGSSAR
jgi:ribosomal protein S18 acetylase RimI-like enzyme